MFRVVWTLEGVTPSISIRFKTEAEAKTFFHKLLAGETNFEGNVDTAWIIPTKPAPMLEHTLSIQDLDDYGYDTKGEG